MNAKLLQKKEMLQRIGIRMIHRIKNLRVGQNFNIDLKRTVAFIKAI